MEMEWISVKDRRLRRRRQKRRWKAVRGDVSYSPVPYPGGATEEDYELYKKMVAYWHEHHDAEGNEK